jgi:hypothetical protein
MKTKQFLLLLVCTFAFTNTFAENRYWVGGATANWADATSWSTTSGGSNGASIPTAKDVVIFDNSAGNANPTVTLTDADVAANSITFTSSNVTFDGAYAIKTINMTVDNSQVKFVNSVTVNSSLSFLGSKIAPRITHSIAGNFILGNGKAFTLTGNSTTNYFDGSPKSVFRYNTTTPLTVFFKPTTRLAGIYVYKGLITLGNNLATARLNFPPANLNNQELILAPDVTFTLYTGGTSGLTELAGGGTVNASAAGSKFIIKSTSPSVLNGLKRIFKTDAIINHLEFNSAGTTPETNTLVLLEPIKVRTLTLTAGTIDNTTNSITIVTGGSGVVTGAGATTVPVVIGASSKR